MTENMTEKSINYDLLLKRAGLWFIAIAVFLLIDYLSSVLLPFFVHPPWLKHPSDPHRGYSVSCRCHLPDHPTND